MKILYVEDDPGAREYIQKGLEENGFVADLACDGEEGFSLASSGAYDLLILDVMLPGRSGLDLLRDLRERGQETPVLFLSARGEASDRIKGLNLGADDYLSKPFAFAELLARVRAIARRRLGEPLDGRIEVEDLVLDTQRHTVERAGRLIDLTPKEFTLLEYLMRNAEQVVSRAMITEKVWGYSFDSYSNLIDVHINHLRKKMDRGFGLKLIHTVKGVGYFMGRRETSETSES
jgi:DNA-binding response OmpR family regulator